MVKKQLTNSSKATSKAQVIIQLVLVTVLLIMLNILSYYINYQVDLTQDKRFTLGEPTQQFLGEIDSDIYVKVYLEGDLPAGFKRLRNATQNMLVSFRKELGGRLEFEFIDPYEIATGKERADLFKQLANKGLVSFELENMKDDEIVHKVVWPSALITIGEREIPVALLTNQVGLDPQQALHNAEVALEYELAVAISRLRMSAKPKIAFITGHGELEGKHSVDLAKSLAPYYDVERISISSYKVGKLESFDAAIVAKPDSQFSEVDMYKLDQFIMKGGKVLWFKEALFAEMDSLRTVPFTTTMPNETGLKDLFFKYGFRLNYDLVQDFNCHTIPIFAGEGVANPNFRPWPYFPLIAPKSSHPIVKNLGLIWFQFASSIDTAIKTPGVRKTVLLESSENSKVLRHPHRINLQTTRFNLDPALFNKGSQALAVLLEGSFTSAYQNRLAPETLNNPDYGKFEEQSVENKMIIVSDGDVVANKVNDRTAKIYPMGYDPYTQTTFANKSFVLNCIDYLVDETGLLALRAKEFKMRLLEQAKVKEEKRFWQMLNLILPLVVLILFGIGYNFLRKRKYSLPKNK